MNHATHARNARGSNVRSSGNNARTLDVGIVIVNWNTMALLRDCLRSLRDSDSDGTRDDDRDNDAGSDLAVRRRVIVIDNASTDHSVAMVQTEFPEVELFINPNNDGFSKANNIGLRMLGFQDSVNNSADERANSQNYADSQNSTQAVDGAAGNIVPPRYALLLNPDTVIPPGGLRKAIDRADREATIGVLGPRLVLPDGQLDLACKRSFPTPEIMLWRVLGLSTLFPKSRVFGRYNLTYLDEHQEHMVDCVVGAFMLIRREAIAQVGLLDERFWMYAEDIDWAFRIKQAGFTVLYYPEVSVLHVKRAASRQNPRTKIEFQRASLLFYRKHYAARTALPLHLAVLTGLILKGGRPLWDEIRNRP